jgi:hypothetical protein
MYSSCVISVIAFAITILFIHGGNAPDFAIGISLGIATSSGWLSAILADDRMSKIECRMDMMEEAVKEMQDELIKEMLKWKQ